MPNQEDTGYKVTDRRKYNADGSPRDIEEPQPPPVVIDAEFRSPASEEPPNNVVSFPAERPQDQNEVSAGPVSNQTADAVPSQTADQIAAGHAEKAYEQARGPGSPRLPEATFFGMANMLGVEAAMHLGLIQNPGEEARSPDLEAARHLIDMLGILQTKTRGNLTAEEDNVLENMLADLRMQYVAISKKR